MLERLERIALTGTHDLLVGDARQEPRAGEQADGREVRTHVPAAPEPVRVPAPQVIPGRQVIVRSPAKAAPVLLHPRVVAHSRAGRKLLDQGRAGQHEIACAEKDTIEIITGRIGAFPGDCVEVPFRIGETLVTQVHERRDRDQADGEPRRVAEAAIGVRKPEKQVGVLSRGAVQHAAVGRQHVELDDGLVHETEAERARLDAETGGRAADGDALQFRDDRGRQAQRQGSVDEISVRRHASTSAVRATRSIAITWLSAVPSSSTRSARCRGRKRLLVCLRSRTGRSMSAGRPRVARPAVVLGNRRELHRSPGRHVARNVAPAQDELPEIQYTRAEPAGGGVQVVAPHPVEAFVKLRVRAQRRPCRAEIRVPRAAAWGRSPARSCASPRGREAPPGPRRSAVRTG